jgi:hypothetical protein
VDAAADSSCGVSASWAGSAGSSMHLTFGLEVSFDF